MTAAEFLTYLRQLDVQVFLEDDRLRCNAPEGVLTADLRAQVLHHKPELIALLRQTGHKTAHTNLSPLTPVSRSQSLPLSFAQQRLWFLDQLVPGNPFYNMPAAVRLVGQIDVSALQQAVNAIVDRHEALRTNFVGVSGQPTQVIASNRTVPIPIINLQSLPRTERQAAAEKIATEAALQPFNLATDALLRVKLLQLDATEYVLLLNLHHIVSDGWSLGVLMRELGELYTSFAQQRSPTLPELPIQYADFAQWQRDWLQGDRLEAQLSYWRQQLKEIPALHLPTDRPRSAAQTYRGATLPLKLSESLTQALEELSQQAGVTLFMTLLAAFQTLLYRYTGQEDIAIGAPIANRNRHELEGLIGFFVNSLVLRVNLAGNPSFRELLHQVKEVTLSAYDHQDLPFEKLVEELHPDRDLSRNPLFQVAFALQNAPMQLLELPGLTLSPLKFDINTTRFDLELNLWQEAEGLSGLWETPSEGLSGFIAYSTALFDASTIARLLNHFQVLLEGIVVNPDTPIAKLPLLTPDEQQQLLVEWNQTQCDYLHLATHQLFEAQAALTPDAIAVSDGNTQLTYRELNQRANQLAHYLQQSGVAPEQLVGICLDRSLEMVISILGIWKAGAAYVPLDPTYPSDRLQFMLADTQATIVLTERSLQQVLPTSTTPIYLDQDRELISAQSDCPPANQATAENLAYVIYTSGSTGTPKGVMIPHRGLCNVVTAQAQMLQLQPHNRILQFSSLNFDASVFELLMAFGSGATLYIPPKTARLPGPEFIHFLQTNAIDTAILPPAVLAVLPADDLPQLQMVIAGGEACTNELVKHWAANRRFFNAYGPTETTIWATVAQLTVPTNDHPSQPSIGRPVTNTQVYLLDSHLNPVPVGVTGEIYIGGAGLAQGYLNRPDLTASKFIPNPFTHLHPYSLPPTPYPLLYKSGDLARYHSDGNLEFLGRSDDQIKLRGFRIELSEIETLLRQHATVREAVTIVHPTATDQQLITYLTLHPFNPSENTNSPVSLENEQINQWQTLYDQTYRQPSASADPTFNIIGWNSSYTNAPIPEAEMRQWVHDRVEQILSFKPDRVLEIGCGTGLLLFQIAPHCSQYWGTDFSAVSLQSLQPHLNTLPQVKLLQRLATDFTEIEPETFDAVILNSIVQYFPSLEYLLQVLEGAISAVAPGGFIWIGDVRNLLLMSAFHASAQLHQSDSSLSREQWQQRVQMALFQETELAIDPAFFLTLQQRFPQINRVEIELTRGRYRNELTQFRYNVILHIDPTVKPDQLNNYPSLNWTQDRVNLTTLKQQLANQPQPLAVTGIPNARVTTAVQAANWLTGDAPKNVGQMRQALVPLGEDEIDPEDWYALATESNCRVQVNWFNTDRTGCYDVVFQPIADRSTWTAPSQPSRSLATHANNPLQAQFARHLIPQLRTYLGQKLPEYMVPSAFVVLEALPLTPNGKIDRRALPTPDQVRSDRPDQAEPHTPLQQTLAAIWSELLGLKQVGIHDNFFELGGHSLLATQLTSRIRDRLSIELPLRSLFEAPTIARLADLIQDLQHHQVEQQTPAIVPIAREAHRRLRSSLTRDSFTRNKTGG